MHEIWCAGCKSLSLADKAGHKQALEDEGWKFRNGLAYCMNCKPPAVKTLTDKECFAFLIEKKAKLEPGEGYTHPNYAWVCVADWNNKPRYFYGATPQLAINDASKKLAEWAQES